MEAKKRGIVAARCRGKRASGAPPPGGLEVRA